MPDLSPSRRKSPPKQARSAAKRDAILDTAERLLSDHHPSAITTRQIAEAAQVPIGSVYRYFSDVDDLLLSLFERINSGTVETLRDRLGQTGSHWRDDLDHTFDHLATMHRAHPAYGPLMAHIDRQDQDEDEIAALLDRMLARNAPHLKPGLARDVTRTVIAMLEGVERRLYRLSPAERDAALDQARVAITAYLAHHVEGAPS